MERNLARDIEETLLESVELVLGDGDGSHLRSNPVGAMYFLADFKSITIVSLLLLDHAPFKTLQSRYVRWIFIFYECSLTQGHSITHKSLEEDARTQGGLD
jgi:hypothetical protein